MFNKIRNFAKRNKFSALAAGSSVAAGVVMSAGVIHADTGTDIGTIATAVGGTFQTNAVILLTDILPYVVVVAILFLAAKLALRWMKKSAH